MQLASNSKESLTWPHFNKIIPFKVKMNLDILDIEGKINVEYVDSWVQQLESYYCVNQLFGAEKIIIAALKMSTFVH